MNQKNLRILKFFICTLLLSLLLCFTRNRVCIWGSSMLPTLKSGQIISHYQEESPTIGDIVVLNVGGKQIIKRVAALPGDTVALNQGILFRNGSAITEPYALLDSSHYGPVTVPDEHLFVLGDNRAYSKDSRQIGCVHIGTYIGTIILPK